MEDVANAYFGIKVLHLFNTYLLQIVALDDDSSMPEGWGEHRPPAASPWTDTSVYELHIRDFRYFHQHT